MTILILKILFVPFGVMFSAFFAGSETTLTSLSSMSLSQLKIRYPSRKLLFEFWENYPDKILTTIVLGNTLGTIICGVLAASIGEDSAVILGVSTRWLIPLLSLLVTALALIFGEILPKIVGRLHSETLAHFVVVPLVPLTKVIHPVVQILVHVANIFVKLLGVETQKEIPTLTAAELKGMMGTTLPEESKSHSHFILKNILEFGQLQVKSVQKPIEKVFAVDVKKDPKEVILTLTESSYSKVLAYRGAIDDVAGIIYTRDLLSIWRTAGLVLIPDLIRPAYFVSETTLISELLREFKKGHYHIAIVQNEMKKVTGIITISDVLEEIVGEVYDETGNA